MELGNTINSKIPFVNYFKEELENSSINTYSVSDKSDFLKISMPAWSFDLGSIKFETEEKQYINIREVYEPYRVGVRSLLALIVYSLGIVYLVKYFLNYGNTSVGGSSLKENDK